MANLAESIHTGLKVADLQEQTAEGTTFANPFIMHDEPEQVELYLHWLYRNQAK
jgi:hypothetical protein